MPMEQLYNERHGYYFDPVEELDLAKDCLEQFEKYLDTHEQKKKKK